MKKVQLFTVLVIIMTFNSQLFGLGSPKFSYRKTMGVSDPNILGVKNQRFLSDGSFYFLGYDKTKYNDFELDTTGGILYYFSEGSVTEIPRPYLGLRFNSFDVDSSGKVYATGYKIEYKADPDFYVNFNSRFNRTTDSLYIYNPVNNNWNVHKNIFRYNGNKKILVSKIFDVKLGKYIDSFRDIKANPMNLFFSKKDNFLYSILDLNTNISSNFGKCVIAILMKDSIWNIIDSHKIAIYHDYHKSLLNSKNFIEINNKINSYNSLIYSSFLISRGSSDILDFQDTINFSIKQFRNNQSALGIQKMFITNSTTNLLLTKDSNLYSSQTTYPYTSMISFTSKKIIDLKGIKLISLFLNKDSNYYFIGIKSNQYYWGFYNLKNDVSYISNINSWIENVVTKSKNIKINEVNVRDNGVVFLSTNYGFITYLTDDFAKIYTSRCRVYYDLNNNNKYDNSDYIPNNDYIYCNDTNFAYSISKPDKYGFFNVFSLDSGNFSLSLKTEVSGLFRKVILNPSKVYFGDLFDTTKNELIVQLDSTKTHLRQFTSMSERFTVTRGGGIIVKNQSINVKKVKYKIIFNPYIKDTSNNFKNSKVIGDTLFGSKTLNDIFSESNISINLKLKSDTKLIGKKFKIIVQSYPEGNDSMDNFNTDTLEYVHRASYDPNDKAVSPIGDLKNNIPLATKELKYLIRFQNKGNDFATNVKVLDTLDKNLDISTFKLISTSHKCETLVSSNGKISFSFNNIMLADSASNEPKSHGYISYIVKPIAGRIIEGTKISNTAYIYFDFNPAIVTNTTKSIFSNITFSEVVEQNKNQFDFSAFPNPANDILNIDLRPSSKIAQMSIFDMNGHQILNQEISGSQQIDVSNLVKGIYLIKIQNGLGEVSFKKFIK